MESPPNSPGPPPLAQVPNSWSGSPLASSSARLAEALASPRVASGWRRDGGAAAVFRRGDIRGAETVRDALFDRQTALRSSQSAGSFFHTSPVAWSRPFGFRDIDSQHPGYVSGSSLQRQEPGVSLEWLRRRSSPSQPASARALSKCLFAEQSGESNASDPTALAQSARQSVASTVSVHAGRERLETAPCSLRSLEVDETAMNVALNSSTECKPCKPLPIVTGEGYTSAIADVRRQLQETLDKSVAGMEVRMQRLETELQWLVRQEDELRGQLSCIREASDNTRSSAEAAAAQAAQAAERLAASMTESLRPVSSLLQSFAPLEGRLAGLEQAKEESRDFFENRLSDLEKMCKLSENSHRFISLDERVVALERVSEDLQTLAAAERTRLQDTSASIEGKLDALNLKSESQLDMVEAKLLKQMRVLQRQNELFSHVLGVAAQEEQLDAIHSTIDCTTRPAVTALEPFADKLLGVERRLHACLQELEGRCAGRSATCACSINSAREEATASVQAVEQRVCAVESILSSNATALVSPTQISAPLPEVPHAVLAPLALQQESLDGESAKKLVITSLASMRDCMQAAKASINMALTERSSIPACEDACTNTDDGEVLGDGFSEEVWHWKNKEASRSEFAPGVATGSNLAAASTQSDAADSPRIGPLNSAGSGLLSRIEEPLPSKRESTKDDFASDLPLTPWSAIARLSATLAGFDNALYATEEDEAEVSTAADTSDS
eukprot:TRINITY_DN5046_c0_g1_i1.p1 TRINITY_DN5046_c0_g1~~TRINITY_DN5046_c0_g1_i1.p1  ORF type:complete len:731 (+),score=123.22 TRINITY_DN5046_c0_g1_i1:123-2315(+)